MKIFYFVKNIAKVPSCHYNMLMLKDLGYTVIAILGESTDAINQKLNDNDIKTFIMTDTEPVKLMGISVVDKLQSYYKYRQFSKRILKNSYEKGDVLFIGTGDTGISLYSLFTNYKSVLCLKELYDNQSTIYKRILKSLCLQATTVVACEKNRARIMQNVWGLKERPFIIPNKPYTDVLPRNMSGSNEKLQNIINNIKNKKSIIYQAYHITYANELIKLAQALKLANKDYLLVLMGIVDNPDDIKRIKEIYPNVYCTGFVKSPKHIEVTSNAYIGITVYPENILNNLFCAPNKIYEYACFGIPTLANDIPGLVETIGVNRAGVCVDWNNVLDLKEAIIDIDKNYKKYHENAMGMFNKTDCLTMINNIVKYTIKKE